MTLSLEDIKTMPARTLRVTLECAGNGRAAMTPRYQSMPWVDEAVGTAEWTGTPLRHLLERAGLLDDAIEIAFIGADRGFDRGTRARLRPQPEAASVALGEDVLVVWAMNGAAAAAAARLSAAPGRARLVRHGERQVAATASRRWTSPIEGFQQVGTYMYRAVPGGPATPVTHMRVKSLLVPPGIPDFYTRARMVDRGPTHHPRPRLVGRRRADRAGRGRRRRRLAGRAAGRRRQGQYAWRGWSADWKADAGEHELACRATDANGETQPLEAALGCGAASATTSCSACDVTVRGIACSACETSTIEVSLWRGGDDGRYQTFSVPQRDNQTVLDVVTWVQRNADPDARPIASPAASACAAAAP